MGFEEWSTEMIHTVQILSYVDFNSKFIEYTDYTVLYISKYKQS